MLVAFRITGPSQGLGYWACPISGIYMGFRPIRDRVAELEIGWAFTVMDAWALCCKDSQAPRLKNRCPVLEWKLGTRRTSPRILVWPLLHQLLGLSRQSEVAVVTALNEVS